MPPHSNSLRQGRENRSSSIVQQAKYFVRLGLKIGKQTAAAILVFLCMVLPGLASAAERKSDLRVTYSPPRLSVEARGVKLRDVLREVSLKVGFDLTDYGIPDKDLTVSIEEATVEEVLRQLLRNENYGVVYREKDRAISKVLLLSSPAYAQAAPMSDNQQTRTEAAAVRRDSRCFLPRHLINQQDRNRSGRTKLRMRQTLRTSLESMRSRVWRDQILFYKT